MVVEPTSKEELLEAREQLICRIHSEMTQDDRSFLMTVQKKLKHFGSRVVSLGMVGIDPQLRLQFRKCLVKSILLAIKYKTT